MSEHIHRTKDGKEIPISKLETSHLENIIALHKRIADEGITIRCGGGTTPDDMWYDEDHLFGKDAFSHLKTIKYKNELRRRLKDD